MIMVPLVPLALLVHNFVGAAPLTNSDWKRIQAQASEHAFKASASTIVRRAEVAPLG